MGTQTLTALVLKEEEKLCGYCEKSLPKEHLVSPYGGHYCNKDCYQMSTED